MCKKIVIRRADASRATTMRRNGLHRACFESFYSADQHRQIFATVSKQFTTVNKSTREEAVLFRRDEGRKEGRRFPRITDNGISIPLRFDRCDAPRQSAPLSYDTRGPTSFA